LEYALNKVGCRALIIATRFKTSDYVGMVNTLAPELAHALPGRLSAEKLPKLEMVIEINANGDYVIIGSTDTLAGAVNARHDSLDVVMQSNQSPLASFSTTTDGNVQMVLRDKTSNSVLGTTLMRDVESVQFVYKNAQGENIALENIVIVAGGGYASLTEVEPRHSLSDANTFIYNPSSSYGNDVYHY
jgi:hypothetical protein